MKISTRGRYALRFMIDLAQNGKDSYVPLKDISDRQGVSIKYLEQITSLLSKFGLLLSIRGPQGGYRLANPPEFYTVGMILRLTEGSLAPVACLEDEVNQCPRVNECGTLFVWEDLYKAICDVVDNITIADIISRSKNGADEYVI